MVGIPKSRWLLGPPSLPRDQRVVQSRPLPEGIFEEGPHGPPLGGLGGRGLGQIYARVVARAGRACSETPCLLWRLHSKWLTPKPVLGTPPHPTRHPQLLWHPEAGDEEAILRQKTALHQLWLPRQGSGDGVFWRHPRPAWVLAAVPPVLDAGLRGSVSGPLRLESCLSLVSSVQPLSLVPDPALAALPGAQEMCRLVHPLTVLPARFVHPLTVLPARPALQFAATHHLSQT